MTRPLRYCLALLGALLLAGCAQIKETDVTDPKTLAADVAAVAIYEANEGTSGSLPDSATNYNVSDPPTIRTLFSNIEFDVERDCTGIEAKDSAYLYVRFLDGKRKVYTLFLLNSHISLDNDRGTCFFVDQPARDVVFANAQISAVAP